MFYEIAVEFCYTSNRLLFGEGLHQTNHDLTLLSLLLD